MHNVRYKNLRDAGSQTEKEQQQYKQTNTRKHKVREGQLTK